MIEMRSLHPRLGILALRNLLLRPTAQLVLGLLALSLHGLAPLVRATEEIPSPVINVAIEQGLLTVDIRSARLADVLRLIGKRAGLSVTIRGYAGRPVTDSFIGVPLDEGIRRLVRGHSLALFYASSGHEAGAKLLTGVWVITDSLDGEAAPMEIPRDSVSQAPAWPERPGLVREVRVLARQARQRDEEAVAALLDVVTQNADPLVRRLAVISLGSVSVKAEELGNTMAKALEDEDSSVRIQAVRAFRHLRDKQAPQVVGKVLLGDPDPRVRRTAARALAVLPGRAAQRALEAAIFDPDKSVRQVAERALARWESRPIARRRRVR